MPSRPAARIAATISAAAILALVAAIPVARAQSTASATLLSDYWFRGVSLSDGRPAAQAAFGYDWASGAYAGAFASSVNLAGGAERGVQGIGYGGWAFRLGDRASIDAGASWSAFSGEHAYQYLESHVGFALDDLSGAIAFAPSYFGSDAHTLYAALDLAHPFGDRVRLLMHGGVLRVIGGPRFGSRGQADGRLALAVDVDRFRLQLARTITDRIDAIYPIDAYYRRPSHGAWIASISFSF